MTDLGKTQTTEMSIRVTSEDPVVYQPYRMPLKEKEILQGLIQDLLTHGIIQESVSPYASPVLLIKKKTGDYRMCIDFRRLNAITVKDKYPLPLVEDQIDRLGDHKYFIGLDLASGYYQVPMAADSVARTTFVTPEGHYEFLRMPFGLANAPAVFQRLINNVLGKLRNTIAFPYIDDIIIPCPNISEGLDRLRSVLEVLREHSLTLKLSKCIFFTRSIEYLGREISVEGERPGNRKVQAVQEMRPPAAVKQVRQFLGLSGYFRKHIKDYARKVEPMTRLLRANEWWHWDPDQQKSFEDIQQALVTRPVLAIYDPTRATELHTDASGLGFGAVLFQKDELGKQRVVAYYSKQTTVDQRHYHSYELETLAVVLALRYFRVYLLGIKFVVMTDCNALNTTFTKKDLIPRVARWWLEVQEYTFEIKYRPGKSMTHVHTLSRYLNSSSVNAVDLVEGDWIVAAQLQDEQLLRIRGILTTGDKSGEAKKYFQEYL